MDPIPILAPCGLIKGIGNLAPDKLHVAALKAVFLQESFTLTEEPGGVQLCEALNEEAIHSFCCSKRFYANHKRCGGSSGFLPLQVFELETEDELRALADGCAHTMPKSRLMLVKKTQRSSACAHSSVVAFEAAGRIGAILAMFAVQCASCDAGFPRFLCAHCFGAAYCNEVCQTAHYRKHRHACKWMAEQ